jgi:hypothetical protein
MCQPGMEPGSTARKAATLHAFVLPVCHFFFSLCFHILHFNVATFSLVKCLRPYHVERTSSRPITEVKQHWAKLVLGWVTAWEYLVS